MLLLLIPYFTQRLFNLFATKSVTLHIFGKSCPRCTFAILLRIKDCLLIPVNIKMLSSNLCIFTGKIVKINEYAVNQKALTTMPKWDLFICTDYSIFLA